MNGSAGEAHDMVLYQIGALAAFATACRGKLAHVKPHGALYNMAAKDAGLAQAIARAVRDFGARLVLFGLAGSELVRAAAQAGLTTANEVFAAPTYRAAGALTPRTQPQPSIQNPAH